MTRPERRALAAAAAFGLLAPAALLTLWPGRETSGPSREAPLDAPALPDLAAAYERPLFAAASGADAPLPQDAPALVGIAGRLGADAVALVRGADGTTRTLHPGESIDGWQLASLAIDAAFFTRGAQRVRVPLPAGE
ncbi:hypothetical protein AB2M62_02470 [Sphingomonas sp. MMS12-HWE2-04]|uniref:hypothetical protein n=1 Tax=Sphingomonas sp. MMS12-HWE2-04 TaxID=3234199 RepID=UPI00384F8B1E